MKKMRLNISMVFDYKGAGEDVSIAIASSASFHSYTCLGLRKRLKSGIRSGILYKKFAMPMGCGTSENVIELYSCLEQEIWPNTVDM